MKYNKIYVIKIVLIKNKYNKFSNTLLTKIIIPENNSPNGYTKID